LGLFYNNKIIAKSRLIHYKKGPKSQAERSPNFSPILSFKNNLKPKDSGSIPIPPRLKEDNENPQWTIGIQKTSNLKKVNFIT
jgi:hypothetical protein